MSEGVSLARRDNLTPTGTRSFSSSNQFVTTMIYGGVGWESGKRGTELILSGVSLLPFGTLC